MKPGEMCIKCEFFDPKYKTYTSDNAIGWCIKAYPKQISEAGIKEITPYYVVSLETKNLKDTNTIMWNVVRKETPVVKHYNYNNDCTTYKYKPLKNRLIRSKWFAPISSFIIASTGFTAIFSHDGISAGPIISGIAVGIVLFILTSSDTNNDEYRNM